ncbi:MAG: hypothetical protein FIB01_12125 [Gemmatimonadetes bacterium]|nr:hypothetical protein [Gemmatimonadota bacterium]
MPRKSTARETAAGAASRLEALLRRASNAASLGALLRALGLPRDYAAAPQAELVRAGIRPSVTRTLRSGGTVVPVHVAEVLAEPGPELIRDLARGLAVLGDGPFVFVLSASRTRTLVFGCRAPDGALRFAPVARLQPRRAELQLLEERAAAPPGEIARLLHWVRVLDRGSVGVRFFRDVRAHRDALARAWLGLPARARSEREQLALLLLCRLLFLCFLQERGHLLGSREFLPALLRERRGRVPGPCYDIVLAPLFFGVFNTRPEQRTPEAAALGPLPYLNGGLFEPHALERRHPELTLPDDVLLRTFSDLLDRYRFSADDDADIPADGLLRSGIDPEVLGRVFEALMAAPRRGETGSFYTPPAVVDRLVARALAYALSDDGFPLAAAERLLEPEAGSSAPAPQPAVLARLRALRVLDPACGSGAFLLGCLARLARARALLEPARGAIAIRHEIVGRNLHGVDLLDDAALLCALRLWLALAPAAGEPVTPLPNLDRRIRQGDALLDPLDLLRPAALLGPDRGAALESAVRRVLRELEPLGQAYLCAEPAERPALRARLQAAECSLARNWLQALGERLDRALREARAKSADRDLWGAPADPAAPARRTMDRLSGRLLEVRQLQQAVADGGVLPFFSFAVHFAAEAGGFDLVLGNPPWVRAHRWPAALAGVVRTRFRVCREAGWPGVRQLGGGSGPGGQVDLAMLFLERGLDLLAERGVLALLLPAKLLRSLYAGGARALLLERAALIELEDHSLDQHAVFQADAFTVQVIAQRAPVTAPVRVTLHSRGREPLCFSVPAEDLPLVPGDARAPWLLAPPDVLAALRAMQQAGTPLGRTDRLALRRGIITGANDVLVVPAAEHHLGGLSRIRAQGWFRARRAGDGSGAPAFAGWIETACLRPLVRGADVKAWRWTAPQRLIWVPANDRPSAPTPARTARYLARHAALLAGRTGSGGAGGEGRVLRVCRELLGPKVVWQDIADDLHAAAVPAAVPGDDGRPQPVVPLNTVYFVAAPDARTAHLLAALLNSLPLRVFARACAERAKDARFRFFAWTVAALPLPRAWDRDPVSRALEDISVAAHQPGGLTPAAQEQLDACVAGAFGLAPAHIHALHAFDTWLRR